METIHLIFSICCFHVESPPFSVISSILKNILYTYMKVFYDKCWNIFENHCICITKKLQINFNSFLSLLYTSPSLYTTNTGKKLRHLFGDLAYSIDVERTIVRSGLLATEGYHTGMPWRIHVVRENYAALAMLVLSL